MSTLVIYLGIAGALIIVFLYALKIRALSQFIQHPADPEVQVAEGLQGGIYRDSSGAEGGWIKKSSVVRIRIATANRMVATILRKRELLSLSGNRYFRSTGHAGFDRDLILFKASDQAVTTFSDNAALCQFVLDYFTYQSGLVQLKFRNGHLESEFIQDGEPVLQDAVRLTSLAAPHIKSIKAIRTYFE